MTTRALLQDYTVFFFTTLRALAGSFRVWVSGQPSAAQPKAFSKNCIGLAMFFSHGNINQSIYNIIIIIYIYIYESISIYLYLYIYIYTHTHWGP